jgi:peptide chain release factor 1
MINWEDIQKEYDQIIQRLTEDQSLDRNTRGSLQKKATEYANLLGLHKEIKISTTTLEEAKRQAAQESGEMKELFEEEAKEEEIKLIDLNRQLEEQLYPADERDNRSVFLEIRAGTGGQEAALFVADLFKMYSNYALSKHWTVSIVETSQTDIGGYKEIVAHIKGKNAYKFLKFESGVHRVQRVPETEGSGRIHTSTVTVAVLPEVDDVEIDIKSEDLRIDVFRAQGAGGQHVNTTDSAVRIVHIPSGLVVSCQDERSQLKNKARAMKVLKSRLYEAEREKREAEISANRKQQIGSGERAEKIRTYNFPQNRVTDHRVGLTIKKLDIIMQGDISELIGPLQEWDLAERKKNQSVLEN